MKPRTLVATLILVCVPVVVEAQVLQQTRFGRTSVSLEAIHASYQSNPGPPTFAASTLTWFLSGQTELRPGMRLVLEVPYSHAAENGTGAQAASSMIGNPYVGVQIERDDLTLEIGGRVPTASTNEYAGFTGFQVDIDRQEAFFTKMATVQARIGMRRTAASGLSLGASAGPAWQISTDPTPGEQNNNLLVSYGGDVGYRVAKVRAGARLAGRVNLSDSGSWGSRSFHQAGLFGDFGEGRIRPGLQLSIPVGANNREYTHWVLGVNAQVALR